MSELEKNNILFWRTTKNNNMMIEAESAFLVSASSETENVWSVDRQWYQSKFEWRDNKLKSQESRFSSILDEARSQLASKWYYSRWKRSTQLNQSSREFAHSRDFSSMYISQQHSILL